MGFLIGIQFLGWTMSGLYFSWTSINEVHGDEAFKHAHGIQINKPLISPDSIINHIKMNSGFHVIKSVDIVTVFDESI